MQDNYILRISHNEQLLLVQGGPFQSWTRILISVTLVTDFNSLSREFQYQAP